MSSKINRGQKRAAGDGKLGLVETRAVESKSVKSLKIGRKKIEKYCENHCFWARFWIVACEIEKLLEKIFIQNAYFYQTHLKMILKARAVYLSEKDDPLYLVKR